MSEQAGQTSWVQPGILLQTTLPTSHPSQPHTVLVTSVQDAGHQINSQLHTWVVILLPCPQFLGA